MRRSTGSLPSATALALALVLGGGCSERCRPGTALVTVSFAGQTRAADNLVVDASVNGGAVTEHDFTWSGAASGTLELQFPSGYHAGQRLDVRIVAEHAGRVVGAGELHDVLQSGCSALGLIVFETGGVGGTGDDGGGAAPPDLADGGPCAAPGSNGVVCAPTSNPCQHAGTCVGGHCGPITQVDDGTPVPGGQYIDRCCGGTAVKLNSDENCGGCGILCRNGYHCNATGATDARMWWCGCTNNSDCWSNCCGTGSSPNTAAKECSPSTCDANAVCQGCPIHSTCEMVSPHYYCHY
jgi:hypothetical protein